MQHNIGDNGLEVKRRVSSHLAKLPRATEGTFFATAMRLELKPRAAERSIDTPRLGRDAVTAQAISYAMEAGANNTQPESLGISIFPTNYGELTAQCAAAIAAVLKDGKVLVEVKFPIAGLSKDPKDRIANLEITAAMLREVMDGFADNRSRAIFPGEQDERLVLQGPFSDGKFRTGYLLNETAQADDRYLVFYLHERVRKDDSLYVIANPSFNVQEIFAVQEFYYEKLFYRTKDRLLKYKPEGDPIIIFNGNTDSIRTDYDWSYFNMRMLPKTTYAYYIANFKGGVLFRCYPGLWQVLRRNPENKLELNLVKEFRKMPSQSDVKQTLNPSPFPGGS